MPRRPRLLPIARARALDALGAMAKHKLSLTQAARKFKTDPATIKRVGRTAGALRKVQGRWAVRPTAKATIRRSILTPDGWRTIRVWGFEDADLLRDYARAVRSREWAKIRTFKG